MITPGATRTESASKPSSRGVLGAAKDSVALCRDAVLLLLGLLLVMWPTRFNDVLVKAGFEEGSIVGFKWKAKLVESDSALKEAQVTITDLRTQNEQLTKALADARSQIPSPDFQKRISNLSAASANLDTASSRVAATVRATLASNEPLVEKAQAALSPSAKWGVVYSGNTSFPAAQYEVQTIAPKFGIKNAQLYFRDGSFRSVAVLDSRAEAEQVLVNARQRRSDAYVVNMSSWCPVYLERSGYRECVK